MELTAEQRAALQAELQALIAELKRRYDDRGFTGIPHTEYLAHWRGVRIEEPDGDPVLTPEDLASARDVLRRRRDGLEDGFRGGIAWPSGRPISGATWRRLERELNRLEAAAAQMQRRSGID